MASPSSAQSASIFVVDWMSKTWCLVIVIAAALLASPLPSIAQETRTQQVQLEQGWNFVSLNVQPDDSSFAAIFGANVDQIAMVKNEEGEVYAPGEEIEQITTWKSGEGYQVNVKAPLTLGVTGTSIRPDSMSIVLEEGGNVVPYLSSATQATETAVASLEGSLVLIEDEAGKRYETSASSSSLDSLRPGQAYKVYIDKADTLRYPIVVPTLAEAKALKGGVGVGRKIRVQGYYNPGDGGGGMFEVTGSACETDGGTCFVFEEDLSSERSYSFTGWPTWSFPHAWIDWGTLEVRYGPDENDIIGARGLHGHTKNGTSSDWLDLKNGAIVGGGGPIRALNENLGYGDPGGQGFTATYRFATSTRRLERLGVTDAVNIAWWGAPRADPNDPETAGHELAWAINAAAELYKKKSIEWAYVDIPYNYYYKHLFKIRNGVKLRGVGADRPVPGESWTTNGALTLAPGEAMYTWHVDFDPVEEHNEEAIMRGGKNGTTQYFTNEHLASKIGMKDLEINGNLDKNQQVFNNQGAYDNLENRLQNASDWTALYMPGNGTLEYEDNMRVELHQLNSVGFGGNNLGGSGVDVTSEGGAGYEVHSKNVRLENAVRNHQLYSLPGPQKENWTIVGLSWGGPAKVGSKSHRVSNYTNLQIKNLETNPWFSDRGIFNAIGKNVTIDGFLVDMTTGSDQRSRIWSDPWGNNVYKGGKIELSANSSTNWFDRFRFGLTTTFKNINVNDNGGGISIGSTFNPHGYNFVYDNVTVSPQGNLDPLEKPWNGGAINSIFGLQASAPVTSVDEPTKSNLEKAKRNEFRQFEYNRDFKTRLFTFNHEDASTSGPFHPYDHFYITASFSNVGSDIASFIRFKGGENADAERAYRLYWDDVTFSTYTTSSSSFHRYLRPGSSFRIRNSQDRSGRTSEASGSYMSDAGDEGNNYVLIPTSLLSRAWDRTATVSSGSRTVQSIEIANSDGTIRADDNVRQEDPYLKINLDAAIQSGNTITVDWTARVTPLEDYQTTGLFVARKEDDKTYTTGNGPWTLDLRGVAASQESREKIVYTASSGDTSVVTANVQSDDYTLELTEQGTGTATITITGSIDGIGTTTDTFQVTIE
jgi:hypothetical protein